MSGQENVHDTSRLFEVLSKVADDYICLIDVDISTGKESQFILHGNSNLSLPKWSTEDDYTTCIQDYATMIVVPEDRERFIEMTRLERLVSVLSEQKEFIILYDTKIGSERRHFQGRFTLGSDVYGIPHMYIGIRDITETYKYESRSLEMSDSERRRLHFKNGVINKRVILIIEDNDVERDILESILSERYHVLTAPNGKEGLTILQREYRIISLVLLDLRMPVMDGNTFMRIVMGDHLLNNIPIVVTTGTDSYDEELECLRNGAADFIRKPYDSVRMLIRLDNIIRLHESDATLAAVEFDDLTGLYTKQAFFHHAENALWQFPNDYFAMVVSDIVGFRAINRRYGQRMGDRALTAISSVIKDLQNELDLIGGRLDTDRFITLVHTKDRSINADVLGRALLNVSSSVPVHGFDIKFGIYDNIDHSLPITQAADRAMLALNSVKHVFGVHHGFYDDEVRRQTERQEFIEAEMKAALAENQFRVYYQPKHDSATGKLVGAEALIRWTHPVYGFISPAEFIPVFERTGFSANADLYVWEQTCRNIKKWLYKGLKAVPISVNISRADFLNPDLADSLSTIAASCGTPSDRIDIDITESIFNDNITEIIRTLNHMHERGFKVEMDDFGNGYSSLNSLAELPIDIVKFDMDFIRNIENPRRRIVLVESMNLAHRLGYVTVAEGVENAEQLEAARECGADIIQGYYYSKPLTEDEFEDYLLKNI